MEELKVACIGDSAVGKTTLLKGFFELRKLTPYQPTIAVERTILDLPGLGIKFHVWDFSGQRYLREFQVEYLQGAAGIILLFDLSRRDTFYSLRDWLKHAWRVIGIAPTVLVGNKVDLRETALAEIMVTRSEGEKFADYLSKQIGTEVPFIEVSAQERTNVNQIFTELGRLIQSIGMKSAATSMEALNKSVKAAIEDQDAETGQLVAKILQEAENILQETRGQEDFKLDGRLIDIVKKGLEKGLDSTLLQKILINISAKPDSIERFFSFPEKLQIDMLTVLQKDPTWQDEKMFHYFLVWKSIESKIKNSDLIPDLVAEHEVSHYTTTIANNLMIYPEAIVSLEGFSKRKMGKLMKLLKEDPGAAARLQLEIYNLNK